LEYLNIEGNPIPPKILDELGGLNRWGEANRPEKFVEYSFGLTSPNLEF